MSMRAVYSTIGLSCIVAVGVFAGAVLPAFAHRSGCHNLHTCPSDSDTYTCGDLGYPCNGATSIKDISAAEVNVPLLVEQAFMAAFDRAPTIAESAYWKARFRSDKESVYQVRRAMAWHAAHDSFGPKPSTSTSSLIPRINALFRAAYSGRNPTVSENLYWQSRVTDKPDAVALQGAMAWHRAHGIQH